MSSFEQAPPVVITSGFLGAVDADLVVLPAFEGEGPADLNQNRTAADAVERAISSREFTGRPFDLFITPAGPEWRAPRLALIGAGTRSTFDTDRLRRVATSAALQARQRRIPRIAWVENSGLASAAAIQAVAEGLTLSAFSGDVYKSGERSAPPAEQFTIVASSGLEQAKAAAERGRILGECCNIARGLCNEPSNVLTPSVFADRARSAVAGTSLGIDVLDERAIAELRMGLLLGVARGSAEPPRLIVLRHEPSASGGVSSTKTGAPDAPVLGLVGKGITFDTGGISIKPADGMERMKDDMSGGAAVISAMRAIAMLGAPIRVIGVVPSTENMPGGRAVKPGDVLHSASGKTVEVLNTDAEGRLVLGDGLWYARQLGATHLVDVATLTGACVVALGRAASGLFGKPEAWVEHVRRTALAAGDRCWPMPLYEEYAEQLRSEIADMVNSGGRPAGACTAAMFLKEFAGEGPWVHLDIAGTAWAEEAKPWQPKGATGVAVRTLVELAFSSVDWR